MIDTLEATLAKTLADLRSFITNEEGMLDYDELVKKFREHTSDINYTYEINNEEDDLFDFDFGDLGGTIYNVDGKASISNIQLYVCDEEADDMDSIDIDIKLLQL